MTSYADVLATASQLPVNDRLLLIEELWNSVPAEALPPISDEWRAEINRRSAEIDAGTVQPIPWEQIRAEALRRAGIEVPDASR
jgi:putative addiction module component (TIGR02574 family)